MFKKYISLWFFNFFIPISIGCLIYVFFRSKQLLLFHWIKFIGFHGLVDTIRHYTLPLKNILPNWVYFSLPNGLWVYSFNSAILLLWPNNGLNKKLWLNIPFSTGILIEVFQFFNFISGTFDILDIVFIILGVLLSFNFVNCNLNSYENQEYQ